LETDVEAAGPKTNAHKKLKTPGQRDLSGACTQTLDGHCHMLFLTWAGCSAPPFQYHLHAQSMQAVGVLIIPVTITQRPSSRPQHQPVHETHRNAAMTLQGQRDAWVELPPLL